MAYILLFEENVYPVGHWPEDGSASMDYILTPATGHQKD
jgi:hypothetical protein